MKFKIDLFSKTLFMYLHLNDNNQKKTTSVHIED